MLSKLTDKIGGAEWARIFANESTTEGNHLTKQISV